MWQVWAKFADGGSKMVSQWNSQNDAEFAANEYNSQDNEQLAVWVECG